ncbi:Retrovirus-related Pol polyprotein from transposon 17.6, partial [Mucuna pruriens]
MEITKKAEFDHPRRGQERSDKTACHRDHLPHLGQLVVRDDRHEKLARQVGTFVDLEQLASLYRLQKIELGYSLGEISKKTHYCFLDGFSRYMQIHIAPEDCIRQPSPSYSIPLRTCACHLAYAMHRDCMEVFMDDLTVYVDSFDACLENLSKVLTRCIDTNLVLNFKNCHFMVTEGIVLGHLVSTRGIEVDKSKIDIITSLSNPTSVQEVFSFLGHAEFYKRFIKNFSKITLPLSKLLQKDVELKFDQPYVEAFQELKNRLTFAPILQAPNWDYPYKLMCDASNSVLGAILGQRARAGKLVHVIAYAS